VGDGGDGEGGDIWGWGVTFAARLPYRVEHVHEHEHEHGVAFAAGLPRRVGYGHSLRGGAICRVEYEYEHEYEHEYAYEFVVRSLGRRREGWCPAFLDLRGHGG